MRFQTLKILKFKKNKNWGPSKNNTILALKCRICGQSMATTREKVLHEWVRLCLWGPEGSGQQKSFGCSATKSMHSVRSNSMPGPGLGTLDIAVTQADSASLD